MKQDFVISVGYCDEYVFTEHLVQHTCSSASDAMNIYPDQYSTESEKKIILINITWWNPYYVHRRPYADVVPEIRFPVRT